MPKPRKQLISLNATPYYHCVSRCVRRAFLCGKDHNTGQSYDHRRQWIEDRILMLAGIFAVDVCAYAVMSNHMHLVLHINVPSVQHWSNLELCERWHRIYKGTVLTQKFARGEVLDPAEQLAVNVKLEEWRLRLSSISWFMRALNEPIARMANAEDKCTGAFRESRFRSQALLDEKALAACMAYVDLNPVRARIADTPEESEHTSIKRRIEHIKTDKPSPLKLTEFVCNPRHNIPQGLPFKLSDYLQLIDWTGRIVREGKRGAISSELPTILERLAIEPSVWLNLSQKFESRFSLFAGTPAQLKIATAR